MNTVEKVKEYFDTINLNHYDLGGCEFQDDDFETIAKRAMTIQKEVEVVPAQLGNTAGVIGASLLIKS